MPEAFVSTGLHSRVDPASFVAAIAVLTAVSVPVVRTIRSAGGDDVLR